MSHDSIEDKINRVEQIREQLQSAEAMNPAKAKQLRDEAMELLDELETDLDVGDGEIRRES
jgi:uncharacterized protein YdcH (DUF465 family)